MSSSRDGSESPLPHHHQPQQQQQQQSKYSEFNFSGDDSNYGNQSIKSEPRRDIVSPPPQEIKKHKIFLSKNNNGGGSVTNARFNAALSIPGHNPLPLTNAHKVTKKFAAAVNTTNSLNTAPKSLQGSVTPTSQPLPPQTTVAATTGPATTTTTSSSAPTTTTTKGSNKRHDNYNKNIYIGTKNAQKWEMLRTKLQCKNDVEFVTHLLNLMEKYTAFKKQETAMQQPSNSSNSRHTSSMDEQEELNLSLNNSSSRNDFYNQVSQQVLRTKSASSSMNFLHNNSNHSVSQPTNLKIDEEFDAEDSVAAEILDYRIAEKIENDLKEKKSTLADLIENVKLEKSGNTIEDVLPKSVLKKKKRLKNPDGTPKQKIAGGGKQKNCWACSLKHEKGECPTDTPLLDIKDKLSLEIYRQIKAESGGDGTDNSVDALPTFAEASLPLELEIITPDDETDKHGSSVFTKDFIPKFSRLGPLIGTIKEESDIADDSTLRFICETFDGTKSTYFDIEDRNTSNWIHFLKPAPTKDQKNCVLKCFNGEVYFVTTVDIVAGAELMYWSGEINSSWTKKNTERTNCGGCNLRFDHLIYYRTHCSIFHDIGFSLTIKKYHCKICKISILGKENIMKHAEQMHDGKGAYQCQFCKKFFLRLNYLDMHRTYGCSANPDRARPLCDFCGRKFCQPQKLKVHIKRMHSDMTDVLRDFQCKMCSKLLGSRAALQRHSKEVHNRESGYVNCPRCQKLFQNRSNLKIHMLTHSGVRPFKCAETECNAAFTTKQCLQFHYKKVHGYTQEQMPKIERSVAYTFDAYSGGLKGETSDLDEKMFKPRKRREKNINVPSNSASGAENLSEIMDSCKEALELTRKHLADDNNSISTSQFNDYDEDDDDDEMDDHDDDLPMQQNSINDATMDQTMDNNQPQVQQRHQQGENLSKNIPTTDTEDKSMNDEDLNLYQGSDDDNQTSNEEDARGNSEAINEIAQYPFNFVPNRQDDNNAIPQSNYNPLTSAFSAHPQSSILNFFSAANKSRGNLPTSAMLVEAALNSVSDASQEFMENVQSGDDNNIDIESVSHKNAASTGPQIDTHNNYISDENSADEQDFTPKNGHASISGSSAASIESKKSEMPLDVTFNPATRKHFPLVENYQQDEREFNVSCVRNTSTSSFLPQREFFTASNTSGGNVIVNDSEPEMNFQSMGHDYKKYDKCFQYLEEMKNLNETLKDVHKRDTMSANSVQETCHFPNLQSKLKPSIDDLHAMNKLLPNDLDLKFKTSRKDMLEADFRTNFQNSLTSNQMYNLNFKNANDFHNELSMPQNSLNYNRYQHHIHDILSDKEQVHQNSAIDSHVAASQSQQEMHSSYLEHHLQHSSNYNDHSEQQSINLCKNSNEYANANCMSPMPQNYTSSHSAEMLRMTTQAAAAAATAQDLCTNMTSSYMNSNQSPPIHHGPPSFLNTQLNPHHNNRDLSEHHRLLASEKFVASRLLVDPVAHRFIEQQHRLLGSTGPDNNKIEQKSLGLSLYHQQIPTHQAYHDAPKSTATNNLHTNYHHLPFSAYYQ